MRPVVDTRSELMSLLSEACELEHGLACAYLYAAFSTRQDLQDDLDWVEQQRTRRWSSQLYFVASQEMLHLAQAWNLLAAIGGAPYFGRPEFPVAARALTLHRGLPLEALSRETLARFVAFEKPMDLSRAPREDDSPLRKPDERFGYESVGELYALVASGFENLPERELFIGDPALQGDDELTHFPDIVRVLDRSSALRAIDLIRHQGEGAPGARSAKDPRGSHYDVFKAMFDEWCTLGEEAAGRLVLPDGRSTARSAVASLFDDVYVLMLRMLAYGWTASAPDSADGRATRRDMIAVAVDLMVTVLKPLGEAAFRGAEGGGPSFGLGRHVLLPGAAGAARRVAHERLVELTDRAAALRLEDLPLGQRDRMERVGLSLANQCERI